jgi:hypothetical protein
MLFLVKLAIAPVLVALVSLAARAWGPTVGGLIMGLPWMTGPVLFFLGLEKGEAFVAQACIGVLFGVVGIASYVLAYTAVAHWTGWPASLAAAAAAYVTAGLATSGLRPSLLVAGGLGAASLIGAFLVMPRPLASSGPRPLPWWDIPMRMLATAALVAVITLFADVLGPQFSGVAATFPVILTVVGAFTHHRWGRAAVTELARGITLSLLSFVAFFLVVGSSVAERGLVTSYALAAAAALAMSAGMIAVNRWRLREVGRPG